MNRFEGEAGLPWASKTNYLESRVNDLFRFLTNHVGFKTNAEVALTLPQKIAAIWEFGSNARDSAISWMFLATLSGVFPSEEDLREFDGYLSAPQHSNSLRNGLLVATRLFLSSSRPARRIAFLNNVVVVDVDFTARSSYTTGIQRVTRNLVGEWFPERRFELVGWNHDCEYLVALNGTEYERMMGDKLNPVPFHDDATMLIPFQCKYFLPEVPRMAASRALAAISVAKISKVTCVGYDMIPVISAVHVSHLETEKFAAYLSALKRFTRVVSISSSAAAEFRGFNKMISAQGISGPDIYEAHLPVARVEHLDSSAPGTTHHSKRILCVGTIEPRKGQRRVLAACETLWKEGMSFEIDFVGHADPHLSSGFLEDYIASRRRGRAVRHLQGVDDHQLSELYENCDFTIFVSEHEGFGLPIAEAIAHGKPVVSSNFGVMKELAELGASVLVDSGSIRSIAAGIKEMIETISVEGFEIAHEKSDEQSWSTFADEVWGQVVRA